MQHDLQLCSLCTPSASGEPQPPSPSHPSVLHEDFTRSFLGLNPCLPYGTASHRISVLDAHNRRHSETMPVLLSHGMPSASEAGQSPRTTACKPPPYPAKICDAARRCSPACINRSIPGLCPRSSLVEREADVNGARLSVKMSLGNLATRHISYTAWDSSVDSHHKPC